MSSLLFTKYVFYQKFVFFGEKGQILRRKACARYPLKESPPQAKTLLPIVPIGSILHGQNVLEGQF